VKDSELVKLEDNSNASFIKSKDVNKNTEIP
jgi:hypothetical protein